MINSHFEVTVIFIMVLNYPVWFNS